MWHPSQGFPEREDSNGPQDSKERRWENRRYLDDVGEEQHDRATLVVYDIRTGEAHHTSPSPGELNAELVEANVSFSNAIIAICPPLGELSSGMQQVQSCLNLTKTTRTDLSFGDVELKGCPDVLPEAMYVGGQIGILADLQIGLEEWVIHVRGLRCFAAG